MPIARISSNRIHYHVSDCCAVVRPEGACDANTTEALAKLVNSPLIESRNLILDLSHTRYIETPGYRWIIRQLRQLENSGKSLVLAGLPESVERTFKLLRLDETIPTADDVSMALNMVRSPKVLVAAEA